MLTKLSVRGTCRMRGDQGGKELLWEVLRICLSNLFRMTVCIQLVGKKSRNLTFCTWVSESNLDNLTSTLMTWISIRFLHFPECHQNPLWSNSLPHWPATKKRKTCTARPAVKINSLCASRAMSHLPIKHARELPLKLIGPLQGSCLIGFLVGAWNNYNIAHISYRWMYIFNIYIYRYVYMIYIYTYIHKCMHSLNQVCVRIVTYCVGDLWFESFIRGRVQWRSNVWTPNWAGQSRRGSGFVFRTIQRMILTGWFLFGLIQQFGVPPLKSNLEYPK